METMQKQIVLGILLMWTPARPPLRGYALPRRCHPPSWGGWIARWIPIAEKARGIAIFQTGAAYGEDSAASRTPPGRSFSAGTERTLRVLDYTVLVVSESHPKRCGGCCGATMCPPCIRE